MLPQDPQAQEARLEAASEPPKFEWVFFGNERFPKHARRHVMRGKSRLRKWAHLRNSEGQAESLKWMKKPSHGVVSESSSISRGKSEKLKPDSKPGSEEIEEVERKRGSSLSDGMEPGFDPGPMDALSRIPKSSYPAGRLGYTISDEAWTIVKEVIFGVDLRTTFRPFDHVHAIQTMRDQCCFRSLLAYAAHRTSLADGEKPDAQTQALVHKAASLRLVNERLADPVQGTSDGTIEAVMFLAAIEARWGTPENCRPHYDGLLQMLALRGGFPALSYTRMETLMCWLNIAYPFHLGSGPYSPYISTPAAARDFGLLCQPLRHWEDAHAVDHVEISPSTARYLGACCTELITFLSSLKRIVHPDTFRDSLSTQSVASEPVHTFLSGLFAPGASLLRLLGHPIHGFLAYNGTYPKGTLYLTAVLFHVHAALQDFWDFPRLLMDHFQRLHRKVIENGLHKGGGVEMVLWTVMEDCAGDSQGLPKRTWLVSRLIMILKRLRPSKRANVEQILLQALVPLEAGLEQFDPRKDGGQIVEDVWKDTIVQEQPPANG